MQKVRRQRDELDQLAERLYFIKVTPHRILHS